MTPLIRKLISVAMIAIVLVAVFGSIIFASGIVYYGPDGVNTSGCTYCRTYKKAMSSACVLSKTFDDIYYVYHIDNGYAGSCDMTGGGGSEPGNPDGKIPLSVGVMLWSTIFMAVAGFILGMTQSQDRWRRMPQKQ